MWYWTDQFYIIRQVIFANNFLNVFILISTANYCKIYIFTSRVNFLKRFYKVGITFGQFYVSYS